jgi:hypothetical protein
MTVPMTTTVLPQQRDDHRLRDLVHGTRDVTYELAVATQTTLPPVQKLTQIPTVSIWK